MLLVVDSHRKSGDIYKKLSEVFSVSIAGDGHEAQQMLRESSFDGIIIRYQLSDMKATKLAVFVQRMYPNMPVFIVSEEMTMECWREVAAVKAIFLPCPIDIGRIRQMVVQKPSIRHADHMVGGNDHSDSKHDVAEEIDKQNEQIDNCEIEIVSLNATGNTKTKVPNRGVIEQIQVQRQASKKIPKLRSKKPLVNEHHCTVITVFSPKGGVGKTTTAVNIAAYTQTELDLRTVIVELTRQTGNVLGHFAINPEINITHWIERDQWPDKEELEDLLLQCPSTGICIIPTQTLIDEDNKKITVSADDAEGVIETLKPHFDAIVIDAGTLIDEVMYRCMELSNHILMVSKLEMEALQDCHYMPFIMRKRGIDTDKLIFIANQVKTGLGITAVEAINMVGTDRNHVIHYDRNVEKVNKDKKEPHLVRQNKGKYFQEIEKLIAMMIEHPDLPKENVSLLKKMKFWS